MFLGIDCGTQGTKALIVDENGVAQGRGYAPHQLIERPTGAREQEPQWWVDAMRTAVRQALAGTNAESVLALGVSGQQHGLVILDEDLKVIRPAKLWNDTETAPQNAELIERMGGRAKFFERFGIIPATGYTVSKLLWVKQNELEKFKRIRHILLPHEYLNFWLTGQICAEYGDASGTGFFDVRSRQWAGEILAAIDDGTGQLVAALPTLLPVEKAVGVLKPEAADDLGLAGRCLVSAGGGDNMMAAIGTGNVREGIVTLSLGTSSTVYSFHREPVLDATGNVAPFCSSSGGWLPLVCTMNATNVVMQTLRLLGKTVGDIEIALESTQAGADGLVFIPFLNGERTPDLPQARGTIMGVSSHNYTPNNLIRAVIEGVSFGVLEGLDLMQQGRPVERMLLVGGGARSSAWRQLLADATGAEVVLPAEEEAGCLGAALQAMYLWKHERGQAQTFEEIVDRCVRVDELRVAKGRQEFRDLYGEARRRYRVTLASSYGIAAKT